MATIFRCDRCGSETIDRKDMRVVDIPRSWSMDLGDTFSKDLCMNCVKQLEEFVRPLPKVAER